jgi:1,4-alpha-glucan branching enzyme
MADYLGQAYVSLKNETDKVLVYERAGLLFVFNFHPTSSFTDYRVGVEKPGEYKIVLNTDEKRFGGFDNISLDSKYFTTPFDWNGRKNFIQVFLVMPYFIYLLMRFPLGLHPEQDCHCS